MKEEKISLTDETELSDKLILRGTNLMDNSEDILKENETGKEEPKKVNSFTTILSIWNSMIGSSVVTQPNNVYYAGIIPCIFLSIIYGLISFYTCKIYVDYGSKEPDFSVIVERYFNKKFGNRIGKIGKNIQTLFNTLITLGGVLIYFLIMSQNLYPITCLILNKMGLDIDAKDLTPEFGRFSFIYLSIILCFVLFPFSIKKDIGFLVKLSSYGIYFLSILIIFIIYTGISSLINTDFFFDYKRNKPGPNERRYLKLFGENPAQLAGALSLGYFCHTTILPTLKSNKKQENNISDLFLGYVFVCLTFSITGILGYIGFSGKDFGVDFKDNWFMFFEYDDYFVLFFRLLSVFQLITVFPILIFVIRFQIFNFFYGNDYPSKKHVYIYAITILFLCLIVAYFFYDLLGKLLGIIGATTSLTLVYTFPPLVKMIAYYMKLKGENFDDSNDKKDKKEQLNKNHIGINEKVLCDTDTEETEETNKNKGNIEKEAENNNIRIGFKDALYFIGQSSFIVIGIATVIFQFVPINFFNVKLED